MPVRRDVGDYAALSDGWWIADTAASFLVLALIALAVVTGSPFAIGAAVGSFLSRTYTLWHRQKLMSKFRAELAADFPEAFNGHPRRDERLP